jgi:hypothetical protein
MLRPKNKDLIIPEGFDILDKAYALVVPHGAEIFKSNVIEGADSVATYIGNEITGCTRAVIELEEVITTEEAVEKFVEAPFEVVKGVGSYVIEEHPVLIVTGIVICAVPLVTMTVKKVINKRKKNRQSTEDGSALEYFAKKAQRAKEISIENKIDELNRNLNIYNDDLLNKKILNFNHLDLLIISCKDLSDEMGYEYKDTDETSSASFSDIYKELLKTTLALIAIFKYHPSDEEKKALIFNEENGKDLAKIIDLVQIQKNIVCTMNNLEDSNSISDPFLQA